MKFFGIQQPWDENEFDHGVEFDYEWSKGKTADEVVKRYPRLNGLCPKGCGYVGIAYASYEYYLSGDW